MQQQSPSDRLALRLADFVDRFPILVIGAALILVALVASGARFLEFSNNYRVFFSPENPELVTFEEFQGNYTKNDNILFVLRPAEGTMFEPRLADAVERLTEESWQIPYALRVDSVTNFQHSFADGDDLTVDDLIRDGGSMSPAELAQKQEIALAEPIIEGQLLSRDAATTAVNVTLQYPEESLEEVPEAVAYARELAGRVEREFPDVTVVLTGVSMLNNAFTEAGQSDSKTLMPLMFVVLIAFMVIMLRSFTGTVATLSVVAVSAASALGVAGWIGVKLTPISVMAPIIIMTLAIADSIHILSSMLTLMRSGMDKREAMRESLRLNLVPVVITSVTTIVGFLALNFSDAPPFRDLGNITAVGIGWALLFSLTLLPALIRLLPIKARAVSSEKQAGFEGFMERMADFVTGNHRWVLFGTAALSLAFIAMVPTLELNDEWVKYFDHRIEFRGDAEFADEHLGGLYRVEYSLPADGPGGISEPAYLEALDSFAQWLREQDSVTHVLSYSDIVKRLNKNMHGDDESWYRLPEDRELAAQYLLLYELSLPYGLDLNDRVNIDKSATRLTVTVGEATTVEMRNMLARNDAWLVENAPESMHASGTGAAVMFSYISERNINSMLRGNAIALIFIAIIMIMALRSLGIGMLSLLPNGLPILVALGIWAVFVGQVGMAAATVSATSLGIVVDDTVHFLAKYLRSRREKQYDRPTAIRYAFRMVGRPIITTTIILAFGFGVLALSAFRINAQMGLLTMMAILIALPIDFLLLPSLLMLGHKKKKEVQSDEALATAS